MSVWDQDKYIKAWNFASIAHRGQFVPGTDISYINHIGLVAMEATAAIVQSNTVNAPDLLVLCALLHDTIEDTEVTATDIKKEFGVKVANGVKALTKNKNLPTKQEQMSDSLTRILCEPKEIWMVKLSDRITNLQPPPKHWDKPKISIYKNEAITILKALGEASSYLSNRLSIKIKEYEQFE